MNTSTEQHLKDIDFRPWQERHENRLETYKQWYTMLLNVPQDERIAGQLTMLSAVLWHELPEKEYKKLTTVKKGMPARST